MFIASDQKLYYMSYSQIDTAMGKASKMQVVDSQTPNFMEIMVVF